MKSLASSKVLCALLAVVAIGMGVQTYYLVQVHSQLDTGRVPEAEASPAVAEVPARDDAEDLAVLPAPDPFAELEEAEERMRTLFDDFYDRIDRGFAESWFDRHPLLLDGDSFLPSGFFSPRVDLQDKGDRYEVLVDLPGADESAVEVRVEDNQLIVEGNRSATLEESEPGRFVRRERHTGRFERRLALPSDADASSLQSDCEDGVLRATLRKQLAASNDSARSS